MQTTKDRAAEFAALRKLQAMGYRVEHLPDGRIKVCGPGWTVRTSTLVALVKRLAWI